MISVIIVDDEAPSRDVLKEMLTQFFLEKFEILDLCSSVDEAVISILEKKPQLVFLDIQMPDKSGFELLKLFPNREFEVVFTTAFSDYAIQAIKCSAFDYLLKPIDLSDLEGVLDRMEKSAVKSEKLINQKSLLTNLENEQIKVIVVPTNTSVEVLQIADIEFIKAEGVYSEVNFKDKTSILVSKGIKHFEESLPRTVFIRGHKSFLVNKNHIRRFLKSNNEIVLGSERKVPVSVRKKSEVLNWLASYQPV